jgi:gas vesicle protein
MANNNDGAAFVAGFIIDELVGAAVALVLAPQSGEETRTQIRERGIELRSRAEDLSQQARERADAIVAEARQRAEEIVADARKRAEEAWLEGREAAMKAREEWLAKAGREGAADISEAEAPAEA